MSALRNAARNGISVPQTSPLDSRQVQNNAGGFVHEVNDESMLERFLVLGSDTPTYYEGAEKITASSAAFVNRVINSDPGMVHRVTSDISNTARAMRNTPAIYVAAAMLCSDNPDKTLARDLVSKTCRTSTHIFELCDFINSMGGWGQAKMKAVRAWYARQTSDSLAYQAVKYRGGRYGWTHRDVLRTVHPIGIDPAVAGFILGKETNRWSPQIIHGFQEMKNAVSAKDVCDILGEYSDLPWEAIPTEYLNDPGVLMALFNNGAMKGQALLRNIGRMDRADCFRQLGFAGQVAQALTNEDMIRATRLHPMNYLNAMVANGVIRSCRTVRDSSLPVSIYSALEAGFYIAFKNVPMSNNRVLLGVDVSGSMTTATAGSSVRPGAPALSCAQAAGALSIVIAKGYRSYDIRGFSGSGGDFYGSKQTTDGFKDLGIHSGTGLEEAFKRVQDRNFGRTDCAIPMLYALENRIVVDTFVVITDNETWFGSVHPMEALRRYRDKVNGKAKLIVVAMTGTHFSIADPMDSGCLDVVGFDSNLPRLIQEF